MKKVYQTNKTPGKGDCRASCVASILGIELSQVPSMLPNEDQSGITVKFMKENGYIYKGHLYNKKYSILEHSSNKYYCFTHDIKWHKPSIITKAHIKNNLICLKSLIGIKKLSNDRTHK